MSCCLRSGRLGARRPASRPIPTGTGTPSTRCGRASTRGSTSSTRSTSTTRAAACTRNRSSANTRTCSAPACSATRTRPARASDTSTRLAESARHAVLRFLHASPDEYDVVFTANASAALRLVGEAYPFRDGSRLLLTADNHNSVNGIREFARAAGGEPTYLPLTTPELRVDGESVVRELDRLPAGAPSLFAYPAQSNYSGVRHPLAWIDDAQRRGWDVLLDAAALVPATPLDLSRWHPDFVARLLVQGLRLSHGHRLAGRAPGGAGPAAPAVVRGRHDRGGLGGPAAAHVGGGPHRVRGRHDRLPRPARHRDRAPPRRVDRARHHPPPGAGAHPAPAGRAVGAAPPGRVAARSAGTGRRTTPTAAARSRSTCWTVAARWSDSGRSRRPPTNDRISIRTGCFCNPGASETARGITAPDMARVFALGHPPSTRRAPGAAAGQGAGRRPGVRRDRDDRARRRAVRRLPAGVRGRVAADGAPPRSPTRP